MADKTSVYPSGPGAIVALDENGRPEFRFTYSEDPAARAREERILTAAVLQIADRAPLFTVPAPLNTNPFDADAYERSDRA